MMMMMMMMMMMKHDTPRCARCNSFQLKIIWGFISELQTNPKPFHLESLWGATLMPLEDVRWTGTEQNSEGGYKLRSGFKPFVEQSSCNFGTT